MAAPISTRSLIALVLLVLAASGASEWWREHQARAVGQALAQQARAGDIQMISSVACVFCERARQWLTRQQVPFSECFIELDAACAARYQALRAPGTPLLLVRGQAQLGFDAQRVLDQLAKAAPAVPIGLSLGTAPRV